jgi:beta-phosphoglucomutase
VAIIKGFIFDLDGVLVDTAKYHYQAWRRMANNLGFDFSEKDNEQLKGVGRRDSIEKILSWGNLTLSEEEKERLMHQKNEWYQVLIKTMNAESTLPGVREFLEGARNASLSLALASSSKNALHILELTALAGYFATVVDGNQITNSKPDPEIFRTAAERLDLEPGELVVFEDAKAGVEAALAGGFRIVGIGNKKSLPEAELVFKGLGETSPAEVINRLNF